MNNELCVKAGALAMDSEAGDGVPGPVPAAGDEVEFQCRGRVTRAEGEKLYVTVSEVNGEPVGSGEPMGEEPLMEETPEQLRESMAAAEGAGPGY